jgi:hypothetical protein
MKNRDSGITDRELEVIPDWQDLALDLRRVTNNHQDWLTLRKIASPQEAQNVVPVLLWYSRRSKSEYLRFKIAQSLQTSLAQPWIGDLLSWLAMEEDPFVQGALAACITNCLSEHNAKTIWEIVSSMPELEGNVAIVEKLYKGGWVNIELVAWIKEMEAKNQLDASLRKMSERLGIVKPTADGPKVNLRWRDRLNRTRLGSAESAVDSQVSVKGARPKLSMVEEVDSAEVAISSLVNLIEEWEVRYRMQVNIGQDISVLLKNESDGILIEVVDCADVPKRNLTLHCALEDEDTVTVRLIEQIR